MMSSFHIKRCELGGGGGRKKREGEKGDGGETWPWPKDTHQHLLKGPLVYIVNKGLMRDQ